ncbi:MAG TPA: hypothetical protein VF170_03400 [Planctomycetaceae bacterium]
MTPDDEELWIDQLLEKHECFTFDRYVARMEVEHDGERLTLLLPDYLARFEVVRTAGRGGVLFLLGRDEREFGRGERLGVLAVARRRPDGAYAVHVWHELYPWALKHLGLDPERD